MYPFAGKIRKETIWKGDTAFCDCRFISDNLNSLFSKLKADKFLVGLNIKGFSVKAAAFLDELNMIHPFREGNGRAIRDLSFNVKLCSRFLVNPIYLSAKTRFFLRHLFAYFLYVFWNWCKGYNTAAFNNAYKINLSLLQASTSTPMAVYQT